MTTTTISEASFSGSRSSWLIAIACASLLLLGAALFNGYPLVFPDTGTYIRQALELRGNPDRPPYYSILLALTNGSISLWLSMAFQCAAVACVILATAKCVCGKRLTPINFLALIATLSAFSSLPWFSGQIMPDIWTAVLVLLVFLRAFFVRASDWLVRIAFVILLAGVGSLHFGNLPLLGGLLLVSAILVAIKSREISILVALAVDGLASIALVAGAFMSFSLAVVGEPKLAPTGDQFFSARLIADGLARPYLEKICPSQPNPYCMSLQRPVLTAGDILWADNSFLAAYGDDHAAKERDAAGIVRGTIAMNGVNVLLTSLRHTATQFVSFDWTDTKCPQQCGPGFSVWDSIASHYPGELNAYQSSRQMTRHLPASLVEVDSWVAWLSIGLWPLIVVWSLKSNRWKLAVLALTIGAGLFGNALIVATLSGVADRYQSRMIWLLPMLLGLATIEWLSRVDSSTPSAMR